MEFFYQNLYFLWIFSLHFGIYQIMSQNIIILSLEFIQKVYVYIHGLNYHQKKRNKQKKNSYGLGRLSTGKRAKCIKRPLSLITAGVEVDKQLKVPIVTVLSVLALQQSLINHQNNICGTVIDQRGEDFDSDSSKDRTLA